QAQGRQRIGVLLALLLAVLDAAGEADVTGRQRKEAAVGDRCGEDLLLELRGVQRVGVEPLRRFGADRTVAEGAERHAAAAGEGRVDRAGVRVQRGRVQRGTADDVASGGIDHGVHARVPALVDAVVEVQAGDRGLAVVGRGLVAPVVAEVAFQAEYGAAGLTLHELAATAGV